MSSNRGGGGGAKKKDLVIDIDDDSDDELFKETKPIFAKRKSPDSVIEAVNQFAYFEDKKPAAVVSANSSVPPAVPSSTTLQPGQQHHKYLGHFLSSVLGAQHFPEQANLGDKVALLHEPTNMFDKNAVKVLVSTGGKLGNLPRDHAATICPMLQQLSHKVAFQATILSNTENRRNILLIVDVYAKSYRTLTPEEIKQASDHIMPKLQQLGCKLGTEPSTAEQLLKETAASTAKALQDLARDMENAEEPPEFEMQEAFVPAEVDMTLSADWESQQQELDTMFEEIQKKQLENLPDIPIPKQFAKMDLYDYQQQGIRWLYHQETSDGVPSWFSRRSNGKWFCQVSGYQQVKDPRPVRGAVLADDMGLGKTLQTLGLILSNPPVGQKGYPYKERSITSGTTAPRCTLIVCPVTVTSNWVLQIRKHVNGGVENKVLKVGVYHGANREKSIPLVQYNKIDVLITSYHTLASDLKKLEQEEANSTAFKKKQKKRKVAGKQPTIFDVLFHRIVLDEAHIIRSGTKTGLYRAAVKLQSSYRLGLTGTPFVNRPSDMHSLLAFLQVEPLSNKAAFDRCITKRIEARDERGLGTLRTAMAFLALRRNKIQVHSTIQLVEKTATHRLVKFPEGAHKVLHDQLFFSAKATFIGFLKDNDHQVRRFQFNFHRFLCASLLPLFCNLTHATFLSLNLYRSPGYRRQLHGIFGAYFACATILLPRRPRPGGSS